ncbi:hypothetical protein V5799_020896, partial [Amblyomma americanum]
MLTVFDCSLCYAPCLLFFCDKFVLHKKAVLFNKNHVCCIQLLATFLMRCNHSDVTFRFTSTLFTCLVSSSVQSPMFDGKTPNWYHFMCFFAKQRPKSVGDIDKFGTLRYEDQKRIQEKIESKLEAGTTAEDLKDFATEYAKSGKSTCKGCNEKIAK